METLESKMNFLRLHISTSNGHPNHVTILSCLSESKKCKHVSSSSGISTFCCVHPGTSRLPGAGRAVDVWGWCRPSLCRITPPRAAAARPASQNKEVMVSRVSAPPPPNSTTHWPSEMYKMNKLINVPSF